jgi:Tol biopolymer transport system component
MRLAGGATPPNVLTIHPLAVRPEDDTRLASSGAIDRDAAWSADGRRIAFMSERDGNPEIYVKDATPGSVSMRLTFDPAVDADPTFSPDGKRLAFTSTRDGNPEIYVMAEDGSGPTLLTFDPAADQQADWSPDGTRIAFESNRDGSMEIYAMNPDGGDVARLTFIPGTDADASWHPDGRSIAFVSGTGATQDIFMLRPGTSPTHACVSAPARSPAWRGLDTFRRYIGRFVTNPLATGPACARPAWRACTRPRISRGCSAPVDRGPETRANGSACAEEVECVASRQRQPHQQPQQPASEQDAVRPGGSRPLTGRQGRPG